MEPAMLCKHLLSAGEVGSEGSVQVYTLGVRRVEPCDLPYTRHHNRQLSVLTRVGGEVKPIRKVYNTCNCIIIHLTLC